MSEPSSLTAFVAHADQVLAEVLAYYRRPEQSPEWVTPPFRVGADARLQEMRDDLRTLLGAAVGLSAEQKGQLLDLGHQVMARCHSLLHDTPYPSIPALRTCAADIVLLGRDRVTEQLVEAMRDLCAMLPPGEGVALQPQVVVAAPVEQTSPESRTAWPQRGW